MAAEIIDWLNLALRFGHVLAAIMWVGSSIFFMWLDFHLEKPKSDEDSDDGKVEGRLWMIHGGGVFHTEKRLLQPDEIPKTLHWFKWEAYSTWLTGFFLLATIHYLNGGVALPASGGVLSPATAIVASLVTLAGGWLTYDLFWRTGWARRNPLIASMISFAALIVIAFFLCRDFNGRAAFLHVGAMLGTMMAGNVFFHIIPNQRKVMAALRAGEEHDVELSKHAKLRSTHNNYMTFPVIFLMISFHYPRTYAGPYAWLVLATIVTGLATIRHFLNIRASFPNWKIAAVIAGLATIIVTTILTRLPAPTTSKAGSATPTQQGNDVDNSPSDLLAKGAAAFQTRACASCHVAIAPANAPLLSGIYGTEREFVDGSSQIADDDYLRESILNSNAKITKGYLPNLMPPFEGVLPADEVDALIAYIKSL